VRWFKGSSSFNINVEQDCHVVTHTRYSRRVGDIISDGMQAGPDENGAIWLVLWAVGSCSPDRFVSKFKKKNFAIIINIL
jgi:hypothetical protein